MDYAILIDGGFAKRKLGNAKQPVSSGNFKDLIDKISALPVLQGYHLHRVYYYDSWPLKSSEGKPLTGGTVDFGADPVVARAMRLFDELTKLPFVALRLGELSFNGWGLAKTRLMNAPGTSLTITAADLKPQIQQKGVDMRIGMDIAALALKKHARIIVLVSGDSDFVPAMKFARREGCQLFLCTLGQRVKPTMYEHSDLLLVV
ncbi:MAG: NYN domain-containing protein [Candidatus Accumulibacter sp.]|jgi:uncharacterized LabA/DUF88 family protein|nr:NYN domain-containing protein [Accumulibacter sp.]